MPLQVMSGHNILEDVLSCRQVLLVGLGICINFSRMQWQLFGILGSLTYSSLSRAIQNGPK